MLNIILSSKPQLKNPSLPKLVHDRVDISLKYILEGGRGTVSELTSQWLTACGVDPQYIVINDVIYKNSCQDQSTLIFCLV